MPFTLLPYITPTSYGYKQTLNEMKCLENNGPGFFAFHDPLASAPPKKLFNIRDVDSYSFVVN